MADMYLNQSYAVITGKELEQPVVCRVSSAKEPSTPTGSFVPESVAGSGGDIEGFFSNIIERPSNPNKTVSVTMTHSDDFAVVKISDALLP